MLNDYKPTHDPNLDTLKVQYLLAGAAVLAIAFPQQYTPGEILWAFSIWLESVAILPQLFMLQRTGEAETITTHYLFALGIYRALYIPNWIYRYIAEGYFDLIPVLAGIVQTVLYSDFFYIYYTKYVEPCDAIKTLEMLMLEIGFYKAANSICLSELETCLGTSIAIVVPIRVCHVGLGSAL